MESETLHTCPPGNAAVENKDLPSLCSITLFTVDSDQAHVSEQVTGENWDFTHLL